jgi:hypothetical protein
MNTRSTAGSFSEAKAAAAKRGLCGDDLSLLRGEIVLIADPRDRQVGMRSMQLRLGLIMLCLRLLQRDPVIAGIELDQQLAGLNSLVVIHVDSRNRAVDARSDRVQMPVDLGVIGVLIALRVEAPADTDRQQHKHCGAHDEGIDAALFLWRSRFHFEAGTGLVLSG